MLLVAFSFAFSFCFAQQFKLQGTVEDEAGTPLGDVAIAIKDLNQLVFTTADGRFTFDSVPKGEHTLLIDWYGSNFIVFNFVLQSDTTIEKPFVLKEQTFTLEELVITGSIPIGKSVESISVLQMDADAIRKEIGGSLVQTLERLPGIKSIGIGSSNSKPLIRGLGFNQVAVIENGIKHEAQQWGADHGLEIDQYRVNKLEIVKGPASFLYGSDALGGVINIKSNALPMKNRLGGSVDLIGKSNNFHTGGSFNLYGRNDKWFFDWRTTYMDYADYRVPADTVYVYSYAVELHKNFVRNTAGMELNNSLNVGYIDNKIKSVFTLSSNFNQSGFFANAHGIAPINVNKAIHDASSRDMLLPNQQVRHNKISNQTNLNIENHQLEIGIGLQQNFRNEFSKYVAHGYMPPHFPEWMNISSDLEREYNKYVASMYVNDQIVVGNHSLSYGINHEHQQNKIGGWGFLIPAYQSNHSGGFVFDKYYVSDQLTLLGALRYDFARMHMDAHRDWFESDVRQNDTIVREKLQRAADFSKTFNNLSWSVGFVYSENNWSFNANLGKSFRVPIAKELAANGVNYHYFRYEKGNHQLSPEQSYQLDLGVSLNMSEIEISLTPFVNYFSNYIFLNPTSAYDTYYGAGNQIFEYTQAEVFRAGFELQANYNPFKRLKIESGFEYLYGVQLSGAKKDYPLPFTPLASGIISVAYEPEILKNCLERTFIQLSMQLAAAQNRIVPPEKRTPGYNVWNFTSGTSLKTKQNAIDFRLNIYNLFNKRYLNHTSFYRLIELPEQGRNIVLSVSIPFDLK